MWYNDVIETVCTGRSIVITLEATSKALLKMNRKN